MLYNREHRDAEEEEARRGASLQANGNEAIQTVITPHRSGFQRIITTLALVLGIGCGCLFGGAGVDIALGKPGALSAFITFGCLTTLFIALWQKVRLSPGTQLIGDVYGHVERSSLRLHETIGRNVEVLSMTVVPEHAVDACPEPLEIELLGKHIDGEVQRGDKVTLHAIWQRRGPIRVKRLYDLTRHSWITAKGRLTALKRAEELLFLAAIILASIVFFLAIARLL